MEGVVSHTHTTHTHTFTLERELMTNQSNDCTTVNLVNHGVFIMITNGSMGEGLFLRSRDESKATTSP